MQKILIFGGSGTIGAHICQLFEKKGWKVTIASRTQSSHQNHILFDPLGENLALSSLKSTGPFNAVCWAQGMNCNDNIYNVDTDNNVELYKANCLFIVKSLNILLNEKLLAKNARLSVISSIWQNIARQDKLSYCMTKAALQGLVLSAATDLAEDGYLINAVLPGALDTPMTHLNLKPEQLKKITDATKFKRLAALDDVANLVYFLCSAENTGITGQFINADLGFSHVRIV
ncbi:3-oxoacyl-[acyl-carrier protein] reductase (EC 1.1.1.100) [Methylomonas albis]|uniref:SDR family oxidoreductase n=1 Tax=Methylomonas albis TaxID=1854563 RepID=A0ABR9D3A0_9GAMM|nr:SDR family oxidoreductase [Methylomonas albis]MBD9356738.1 SDR family oxidoreductase [Methylomonas albis]CAD6879886.1 3-oxoacyl-[acyl-carrier protein] reductase (EC 1.1.1.100) [Methylomonas albis]